MNGHHTTYKLINAVWGEGGECEQGKDEPSTWKQRVALLNRVSPDRPPLKP